MNIFDGKKIREEILIELKSRVSALPRRPTMAVFLVGDDPVSVNYVRLKQKIAENIGVEFLLFNYSADTDQEAVYGKIIELNRDSSIDGIMIQIPMPEGWDRDKFIRAIAPNKDIDGLRYCLGEKSEFIPPVVLAIDYALDQATVNLQEQSATIVGQGFLVGNPLYRYLRDKNPIVKRLRVVYQPSSDLSVATKKSDVIISAVGKPGLISAQMITNKAILIDAGTSEQGGKLMGDINSEAYQKSSFFTPVPGGIGPVTVAMLMKNLVDKIH